jgi:pimeloyl-ACP methyl ester carboxylesterase
VRLAHDVTGDGPVVLLVHGFPDSRRLWRNQVAPLADAGFRVLAPDLRGFGESGRPEEVEAYGLMHVVGDLLELLDEHGVERAHVVGHDWGAGVSWLLAALQPDRVDTLAALSVGHPNATRNPSFEQRQKAWYTLFFQFEEAEELLLRDDAKLLREWIGAEVDAERYLEDLTRPGALTAGLNYYRANMHPRRQLQPRRELPAVAAPALGIWSTGDRYLTEDGMRGSSGHVTGPWRYERIEGAGHWMQLDAPERVTQLLLEHLAR